MIEKVIQFFKTTTGKIALVAFLLGVLFGWLIIGWGIWPVQWVDAGYVDLQEGYRMMAMENAINAYAQTDDGELALLNYNAFGGKAADTLAKVKASQKVDPALMAQFEELLQGSGILPILEGESEIVDSSDEMAEVVEDKPEVITTDTEENTAPENSALSKIGVFLGVFFALCLIAGAVLIYMFIIPLDTKKSIQALFTRNARPRESEFEGAGEEAPAYLSTMGNNDDYSFSVDVEPSEYEETTNTTPAPSTEPRRSAIERTINYVHNDAGRSHLDQNFSLKDTDDSGKTVLEYGVAMSDSVELDGVVYALAFDVYLASHPERQTITRVLVNKDLLNHPEVLQRYEGKGEPIKIDEFHTFQLETAQYRLNGTIVAADYVYDAKYGGNYLREMEVDMLIHYL